MIATKERAEPGTHPKWEACIDCAKPKTGQERKSPKCKPCAMRMEKPRHATPVFDENGLKACTKCGVEKTSEDFGRHPQRPDGRDTKCKVCKNKASAGYYQRWTPEQRQKHRARVLRCRYGVEIDLLQAIYERQEGCCAICSAAGDAPGVHEQHRNNRTALVVDHDHESGEIRGLLCDACNVGLGRFNDSPLTLVRAAAYLGGGANGRYGRLFTD